MSGSWEADATFFIVVVFLGVIVFASLAYAFRDPGPPPSGGAA